MCLFGRPRLLGQGFKWAVGRWLRAATRVGLDSPDRRDGLDMPDSLADHLAPPRSTQRGPENSKSVRPGNGVVVPGVQPLCARG